MDNKLKIIKIIIALIVMIALLAYTDTLPIKKSSKAAVDEKEDIEAACAIMVMNVY